MRIAMLCACDVLAPEHTNAGYGEHVVVRTCGSDSSPTTVSSPICLASFGYTTSGRGNGAGGVMSTACIWKIKPICCMGDCNAVIDIFVGISIMKLAG